MFTRIIQIFSSTYICQSHKYTGQFVIKQEQTFQRSEVDTNKKTDKQLSTQRDGQKKIERKSTI